MNVARGIARIRQELQDGESVRPENPVGRPAALYAAGEATLLYPPILRGTAGAP